MSSLTRDNIDELVKNHGLRSGYELKIMGKDNVIKGVQFARSSSSDVAGLPSKRSIVNDDDALNNLEKELLVNFGKQNRRDAAERIVEGFNSLKERFLLPEGVSASVQDLGAGVPTLKVVKSGHELASLALDKWPTLSNSLSQQNKPYFAPQLEQVMLSIGQDKHSVDIEFSLPLDWSDISDEDGYGFSPNLADEELINEINESIKIEVTESIIGDIDLDQDVISISKADFILPGGFSVGVKTVKRKAQLKSSYTAQIAAKHAKEPVDGYFPILRLCQQIYLVIRWD